MIFLTILLLIAVALSAFFSGGETAFFRASRIRLSLDGLEGNRLAKALLWLVNNPPVFVATNLVGTNLASNLLSLVIVLMARRLFGDNNQLAELVLSPLLAPFLFIYCDLLPKQIAYMTPNRMLRTGGPLILASVLLFAPISIVLWLLNRLIERFVGESPENVRLRLVRSELERLLDEGHEAGVLRPTQRTMAKGIFDAASRSVAEAQLRPFGVRTVRKSDSWGQVVARARRQQVPTFAVMDDNVRKPIGYVRVIDVYLAHDDWNQVIRSIPKISRHETQLASLILMHTQQESMLAVTDESGQVQGLVTPERLSASPLAWDG